jgi:hypothetical protein
MSDEIEHEIPIVPTTSRLGFSNRWDHFLARMSWRRGEHHVSPGLYSIGHPGPDSPVLVSSNYTLSFDALRGALTGVDAYILVINTFGINVWCAAGKRTFGTEEIVERIETSELARVVRHRTIILPQLGAPGVAAHKVKKESGFKVEYGPVRAKDLPEYLKTHKTTPAMRLVRFGFFDRLVLTPVEIIGYFLYILAAAIVLFFWGDWSPTRTAPFCSRCYCPGCPHGISLRKAGAWVSSPLLPSFSLISSGSTQERQRPTHG